MPTFIRCKDDTRAWALTTMILLGACGDSGATETGTAALTDGGSAAGVTDTSGDSPTAASADETGQPTPTGDTSGDPGGDPTSGGPGGDPTGPDDTGETGEPPPPDGEYPLPPGVGSGQAIYVATDGDDANDGKTLETPVKTLQRGVDIADPGAIIYVRAGMYAGFVVSDGDFGAEDQWILMRPYEEEAVTVRGAGEGPTVYFYAKSCDEENELVNGDCERAYFRLEGLHMQGSPDGGGDGNVIKIDTPQVQVIKNRLCCSVADVIKNVRTGDDTKIVGNEIWQDPDVVKPGGNAQGVDITGADRLLVARNYFHDLTDIAMYAKGNAREALFEGNRVNNTGLGGEGNAIMCGQSTDADRLVDGLYETYDCTVRNNVISRVSGACVAVGSSQDAQVFNNTCVDTATKVHAALFLTNESEVNQASTNVEFRGNVVAQTSKPRMFTDSDELGMTDWSTLKLADNLYYSAGEPPMFSLKMGGLADGGGFEAWSAALMALTGHPDASEVADPAFAETELYTPTPGSPAVDAMACVVDRDYSGAARPVGGMCDIGAHELGG